MAERKSIKVFELITLRLGITFRHGAYILVSE